MNQGEFTEKLLSLFEEAMEYPDNYMSPNYLNEILDVIHIYHGVDEERFDKIQKYVQELYEL